jgi:alpha-tubulin suppressor-like RCC1 family protein
MFGQMGDGTNLASSTPHRVLLPEQVKAQNIDAGTFHTCATTTTGQTYCWGSNEMGQLGYKGASSNIPVIVADVSDARQIQASGLYGCTFVRLNWI